MRKMQMSWAQSVHVGYQALTQKLFGRLKRKRPLWIGMDEMIILK
jgi:hypothetical protein